MQIKIQKKKVSDSLNDALSYGEIFADPDKPIEGFVNLIEQRISDIARFDLDVSELNMSVSDCLQEKEI